ARMHKEGLTLLVIASSLVNIDILTPELFTDAVQDGMVNVDTAVLCLKSSMVSAKRFIPNIAQLHFYEDGIDPVWAERFCINDTADCRELRYLDKKKSIDIGLDFGNMMSMTIAQMKPGNKYRVLKFMYTLSPQWIHHLAKN